MESASLLILLERVLSGRPGDPHKHSEAYNKLHTEMLSASEATLRAALITTKALQENGEINKSAGKKFLDYLRQIKDKKKPIPPDISYLTFSANPACQSSAKLFHSLIRLSNVRTSSLRSGFNGFRKLRDDYKIYIAKVNSENKIRTLKSSSIAYSWMKNMNIKTQRALLKWKHFCKKRPNFLLLDVVKKAELRYFYIKFLGVERWVNETWDFKDRYIEEEGVGRIIRERVRRPTTIESFNNVKISEILYHMTAKTHLGNDDFDYRVQALSRLLNKDQNWREKTSKLITHLEFISKLRKQFPVTLLSFWSQKFIEKFDRNKSLEISCENIRKIITQLKLKTFLFLKEKTEKTGKEISRKLFLNLVQNSLKVVQAPRLVFEKLQNHQIFYYNKNIKYKKSVLSSLLKSSKNTQFHAFNSWKIQKDFKSHTEKSRKVRKFIKVLLSSLSSMAKIPLTFPDLIKKQESCLIRSVINACKNLRFILNVSFQRWLKLNRSQVKDRRRIKRLVMHSLSYIARTQIKKALSVWKQNQIELQKNKLELSNNNMQKAITKNKRNSVRASANNLINALKCGGLNRTLVTALKNIVDKTPELYRVRLLGSLKHLFKKKMTKAIRHWFNTVRQIRNYLQSRRNTDNSVLKTAWNFLNSKVLKFLKPYFDRWVDDVLKNKRKIAFDHIRSLKFFKILKTLPFKILKITCNRLTRATNIIEQTLENLYFSMKRKPKHAFDTWRFNAIKSKKLNILNKLRAEQVCRVLQKVPNKKLRRSFNSVVGTSIKIKHAMRNLLERIRKRLRTRLSDWKNYCSFCSQAELDLDYRLFRFLSVLKNPIKKPLRTAFSDLKYKRKKLPKEKAVKNLAKIIKRQVSGRLAQYSKNVREILFENKFRDKIRGFKLCKLLEFTARSRLKMIFNGIGQWKNLDFKASSGLEAGKILKVFKFQTAFTRLLKRTLREASTRMMQGGVKIENIMEGFIDGLKGIPRYAIRRWNKVIVEKKEKALMTDVRAHKMCPFIKDLVKRISRTVVKCVISSVSVPENVKILLIGLKKIYKKYPKKAFEIWKNLCFSLRKGRQFSFISGLTKLSSFSRNFSWTRKKQAFYQLLQNMFESQNIMLMFRSFHKIFAFFPKSAFNEWKNRAQAISSKIKLRKLKALHLSSILNSIFLRNTQSDQKKCQSFRIFAERLKFSLKSLNKIKKNCLLKLVLNWKLLTYLAKSQKTLNYNYNYPKVPKENSPTTRVALKEDRVKSALNSIYTKISKFPKLAFLSWKRQLDENNKNLIFNELRSIKLVECFSGISRKNSRIVFQKITGPQDRARKAISDLMTSLKIKKNQAFEKLKGNVHSGRSASIKRYTSGKLIQDNIKKLLRNKTQKIFDSLKALTRTSGVIKLERLSMICRKLRSRSLASPSQSLLLEAFQAFQENMRKKQLLFKIQGALRLYQTVKSKPKITLRSRFSYWKNLEALRLYRLKKKSVMKWIFKSSINYQNSFWKLKFVWNKRYSYYDPRHSMIYRKLIKIGTNYQTRLKQFAHFKLEMHYKTMPYPIRRLAFGSGVSALARKNSEFRALAFISKPENIEALSRGHTPTGYRKALTRALTPSGKRVDSPGV